MAIRLIQEDERFDLEILGCIFEYRRIPADIKQRIVKENTHRGVVDDDGVMEAGFSYAVTGWRGDVPTLNGEPAEFSQKNLMRLPDPVKAKLTVAIFSNVDGTTPEDGEDPLGI